MDEKLKVRFEEHLEETRQHVNKFEQAFEQLRDELSGESDFVCGEERLTAPPTGAGRMVLL